MSAPTESGTLTLDDLRKAVDRMERGSHTYWLNSDHQLRAIKDAVAPLAYENAMPSPTPRLYGVRLVVDPEENPFPGLILADARRPDQIEADRKAGRRAFEALLKLKPIPFPDPFAEWQGAGFKPFSRLPWGVR